MNIEDILNINHKYIYLGKRETKLYFIDLENNKIYQKERYNYNYKVIKTKELEKFYNNVVTIE